MKQCGTELQNLAKTVSDVTTTATAIIRVLLMISMHDLAKAVNAYTRP